MFLIDSVDIESIINELGYSFKDDLGLDDNDFLTTMLFPIGMGDEHNGIIQL